MASAASLFRVIHAADRVRNWPRVITSCEQPQLPRAVEFCLYKIRCAGADMAGYAFDMGVRSTVLVCRKFGTHHAVACRSAEFIAFHVVNGLIAECATKDDIDNSDGADKEEKFLRRFAQKKSFLF